MVSIQLREITGIVGCFHGLNAYIHPQIQTDIYLEGPTQGWEQGSLKKIPQIPSANLTVCYRKLPFIVDLSIENCDVL